MTDSKPETRRTAPTPDAPDGYEYIPASDEVHRILGHRFDVVRPTAIDPERPGFLLYDFGNFWDGAQSVRDNGDGTYSHTSPYTGETDRFDAAGYWTSDGERRPWPGVDVWKITIAYADGHTVKDLTLAVYQISEVVVRQINSQHGGIKRIVVE